MKKIAVRIGLGIATCTAIVGVLFYFFLFSNPLEIVDANRLKWIPILIASIGFLVSGRINRSTPLKWFPLLLLPLILFKPFNYVYFPFVLILFIIATLMLLITRANQKRNYQGIGILGVLFIIGFYLFSQPLIIAKPGFGYDEKGEFQNARVIWDFSSKETPKLPSHILFDENKAPFNLVSLKGKVYFISFWASWCLPCMQEKPELEKLKRQFKRRADVEFVDVSFDLNKQTWTDYLLTSNPYGKQLFSNNHQETSRELNFAGLPMHLIVDENGGYKKIRSFDIAKSLILERFCVTD